MSPEKENPHEDIFPADDNNMTMVLPNGNHGAAVSGLTDEELKSKIRIPDWSKLESFTDLSLIGIGGMGTVFSARDPLFFRNIALKILRPECRNDGKTVEAFIREARITAQIDHPNIVPVYQMGIFDEAGIYFSMKKVNGQTLAHCLKKLDEGDPAYQKKYSLRRRLEIFVSICNGIAFAHSKGVVHRDLKPANVMLGEYGEVFIMDWGMALYSEQRDSSRADAKIDLGEDELAVLQNEKKSRTISGTPAFMSPEQVRGETLLIDELSDIYALGALLYTILTCKNSPFDVELDTEKLLGHVLAGNIVPPRKRAPRLKISKELEAISQKAMSKHRLDRYRSVDELIQDVRNYLDMYPVGVYTSPVLRLVKLCRRKPLIPTALLAAMITLGAFFSYTFVDDLLKFNSLMEVAEFNLGQSESLFNRLINTYRRKNERYIGTDIEMLKGDEKSERDFALESFQFNNSSSLALDALAKITELRYRRRDVSPEIRRLLQLMIAYNVQTNDSDSLNRLLKRLNNDMQKNFYQLLEKDQLLSGRFGMLQRGEGLLSVRTTPDSDIVAEYYRDGEYDEMDLVYLGATPNKTNLKKGTYILTISGDSDGDGGGETFFYPLSLHAGERLNLDLDLPLQVPQDMVYVHKGDYYSGINAPGNLGRKRYLYSYFLSRDEVTFGEYIKFWKQLKDPSLRKKYRARIVFDPETREMEDLWNDQGVLRPPFRDDMPVVGLSAQAAEAFCRYKGEELGMVGRLPTFGESEKAARGADRRVYVWGDVFDHNKALLKDNSLARNYPYGAPVGSFPLDRSVYGVNDLAGNVRELVRISGGDYGVFGGSYLSGGMQAKINTPGNFTGMDPDVGFRYVLELPEKKKQ